VCKGKDVTGFGGVGGGALLFVLLLLARHNYSDMRLGAGGLARDVCVCGGGRGWLDGYTYSSGGETWGKETTWTTQAQMGN
jgi:hypothetical protein